MAIKDSTLKITVDVERAEAKARSLANELSKLGNTGKMAGQQVEAGMTSSAQSLMRAGDSAAAAQIKFQTMTQGMLNLSTAAVQTYTSTSNLDRVMVKSKASVIAHERSLDALNRKQFQLNKEMDRAVPNMEKIALLRNEIKTATENETVALDKMKIAQQDVTDVQLLFISNMANVGVASLQTFTRMIGEQRTAMIANTIITKINKLANINNATTLGSSSLARSLDSIIIRSHMRATVAGTLATRLQTVALQGLKIALGGIALPLIAITAAFTAYETNMFGLKDTINGLLGIHDDLKDSMDEGKDITDEYTGSLGNLADSFGFKIPNSIASAIEELERYRLKIGELKQGHIELNKVAGASSAANFQPSTLKDRPWLEGLGSFLQTPSAFADSTANDIPMSQVPSNFNFNNLETFRFPSGSGRFTGGGSGVEKFGLESTTMLQRIGISSDEFRELSKDEQFMAVYNQGIEPFLIRYINDPKFRVQVRATLKMQEEAKFFNPDEKRIRDLMDAVKELDKREADVFFGMSKERKRRHQISLSFGLSQESEFERVTSNKDAVKMLREYGLKNTIINGIPVNDIAKFAVANRNPLDKQLTTNQLYSILGIKRNIPMTIDQTIALIGLKNLQTERGNNDVIKRLMLGKNIGFRGINPNDIELLNKMKNIGSSIPITKDMLPIEIGNIKSVLDASDFNRLQIMETTLRDYSKYINISSQQNNVTQGDKFRGEIRRLLLTAGGKSSGLNTGRVLFAGVSATAAFQTSGNFKIDSIFEERRRQQDRLANSSIMGLGSIFGFSGGRLSRSGSSQFRAIAENAHYISNIIQSANLFGFGSDSQSQEESNEIYEEMIERFNAGGKQARYAANSGISKMAAVAERFGNRVEGILGRIGIDFETTQPVYEGPATLSMIPASRGNGGGRRFISVRNQVSTQEQYRRDLGASIGTSLPFGMGLLDTVNQFINNGMFTDFNNVGITKQSMAGLNLTEQAVFDIRFQSTRGDRELLNRLRHMEMLQAGTSGTSPL